MLISAEKRFTSHLRRTRVSAENYGLKRHSAVRTEPHSSAPGLPHQRYRGPERRAHGWHVTEVGWAVIAVLAFWVVVIVLLARCA